MQFPGAVPILYFSGVVSGELLPYAVPLADMRFALDAAAELKGDAADIAREPSMVAAMSGHRITPADVKAARDALRQTNLATCSIEQPPSSSTWRCEERAP